MIHKIALKSIFLRRQYNLLHDLWSPLYLVIVSSFMSTIILAGSMASRVFAIFQIRIFAFFQSWIEILTIQNEHLLFIEVNFDHIDLRQKTSISHSNVIRKPTTNLR